MGDNTMMYSEDGEVEHRLLFNGCLELSQFSDNSFIVYRNDMGGLVDG